MVQVVIPSSSRIHHTSVPKKGTPEHPSDPNDGTPTSRTTGNFKQTASAAAKKVTVWPEGTYVISRTRVTQGKKSQSIPVGPVYIIK